MKYVFQALTNVDNQLDLEDSEENLLYSRKWCNFFVCISKVDIFANLSFGYLEV